MRIPTRKDGLHLRFQPCLLLPRISAVWISWLTTLGLEVERERRNATRWTWWVWFSMMTSSSGNILRVTGLCARNSPVTGEFPAQRPVTRSFDVFFDLRLNKQLSKQWWGGWFETPLCPLWRHCNVCRDYGAWNHRQLVCFFNSVFKGNTKAPNYWTIVWETTSGRWIPHTKGP